VLTSIKLIPDSMTIGVKGSAPLTVQYYPPDATNKGTITWSSSPSGLVGVTQNGTSYTVYGLQAGITGKTTLTATSSIAGVGSATCIVTVTAAPVGPTINIPDFDSKIHAAITKAFYMPPYGSDPTCTDLSRHFIESFTTLTYGNGNGGTVATHLDNEVVGGVKVNQGKGKLIPVSATSLGITGPAVGIFSTYASSMVRQTGSDPYRDDVLNLKSKTTCLGHTGIIVIYSDGSVVMYDQNSAHGKGASDPAWSYDNNNFSDLFKTDSYTSFYWIDGSALKNLN